jgi:hypothetical protein
LSSWSMLTDATEGSDRDGKINRDRRTTVLSSPHFVR